MPSVRKKQAQNRITLETKKMEEKCPVLSIGRTRTRKGQLPRLITLIRVAAQVVSRGQIPFRKREGVWLQSLVAQEFHLLALR